MERIIRTCQICENHCELEAEVEDGEVLDVSGNGCMKGHVYIQQVVNEEGLG